MPANHLWLPRVVPGESYEGICGVVRGVCEGEGMILYLIGSLRNPQVPIIAEQLRVAGHSVFDDWYAAGPEADDKWRDYEQQRGHSFAEALGGFAAGHVFEFDRLHLTRCDAGVLVLPAGRSAHLELGVLLGEGKPGYILHDNPERWDVMYRFADGVYYTVDDLIARLAQEAYREWLSEQSR